MTTSWQWDETLFAGAAAYYEQGRLPYAPGLAEAMAAALGLDGGGRLLDVGCGPGTVALRVAHLFEEVVGVDADRGMIEEARRLAAERGITNATWAHFRAEELPAGLGVFRVATFAQSLHWMDRPRVFATVRSMLEPGGAVVHVDRYPEAPHEDGALPHPLPPEEAIAGLVRRYLGPERRAGASVCHGTPDGEDEVFRAAGFVGPERVPVPDGRVLERSIDDVVAGVLSSSGSAPHLFGERLEAFEGELRALLAEASGSGAFSVRAPGNELKVWRVGPGP